MLIKYSLFLYFILFSNYNIIAQDIFESDIIKTSGGDLKITFIGHASLIFNFNNMLIYIDPISNLADYAKLPKADMILITHDHYDHFDKKAIDDVKTLKTKILLTETCAKEIKNSTIIKNGDTKTINGIKIEAVPAYNIIHKRENGQPYHPKGVGNGYVITFADTRVYVAGDTENIPEMKMLKDINIAFLPMNLPYTMTPEMVVDAINMFKPKIVYPYHFGDTDTSKLLELLKNNKEIEVKIRKMK